MQIELLARRIIEKKLKETKLEGIKSLEIEKLEDSNTEEVIIATIIATVLDKRIKFKVIVEPSSLRFRIKNKQISTSTVWEAIYEEFEGGKKIGNKHNFVLPKTEEKKETLKLKDLKETETKTEEKLEDLLK